MIQATEYLWVGRKGWTPKTCAAIEACEAGLVKGIHENVKRACMKKRSGGDEVCEVILKVAAAYCEDGKA